ncbi:MAG: DinB family protein [Candidatus Promineifilaceae bacterium]|nr:DinB family protein [Candidatus Promineifilaceae bacterium]
MMLDFTPVREEEITISDLAEGLGKEDLRALTIEMLDKMSEMVAECVDADVVFVPDDPDAYDSYAASEDEVALSWTLGHVIVHTTASAEEAAFLAAELARGVKRRGGRARTEVPWRTVTTIAQVKHRLAESRRMRLASLDMWPDEPYLENSYMRRRGLYINAVSQFLFGLLHDDNHVEQIANIVVQARAARESTPVLQER